MDSDHYLGWLALALTPGLGARMAGKLLREMGNPQEIFNASLTELEGHHLPTAVAQAIHSRRPSAMLQRSWQQPRRLAVTCSHGMNPHIRPAFAKSTIRRPFCMSAETLNFSTNI